LRASCPCGVSPSSSKNLCRWFTRELNWDCGYRLDFIVADMIVVEVKAIDALLPHPSSPQLLSYLKLGGWKLGLLINFHVPLLRDGIKRVVLNLEELSD
jgi:GxxExxY protein